MIGGQYSQKYTLQTSFTQAPGQRRREKTLRHGQRFAYWTEEPSQLLQETLKRVFTVSKSTTTLPSRRVVVETDINKVQQPTILRDLYTAWNWIHSHKDLFRGKVTEPAFQLRSNDDQQNALKRVLCD